MKQKIDMTIKNCSVWTNAVREVDEDPTPEGYTLVYDPADGLGWSACDGRVNMTFHPTYKAAVRWCWAHSQGLL